MNSPFAKQVKLLKRGLFDFLSSASVETLVLMAIIARVKIPNGILPIAEKVRRRNPNIISIGVRD